MSELEADGGFVARRLSGGGAVYHDLGNLNFTFLMKEEDFNLDRQLNVIVKTCENLGISVEKSGRNDILANGCKFSGNAFFHSRTNTYHHGTLLVSTDKQMMAKYLKPSVAKLESKGVKSVKSRVINLNELSPDLTIDGMKREMLRAYENEYGMRAEKLNEGFFDMEEVRANEDCFQSYTWKYGQKIAFSWQRIRRFTWGEVQICCDINKGIIEKAVMYSDAMEWQVKDMVEKKLTGCRFRKEEIWSHFNKLPLDKRMLSDILRLLVEPEQEDI